MRQHAHACTRTCLRILCSLFQTGLDNKTYLPHTTFPSLQYNNGMLETKDLMPIHLKVLRRYQVIVSHVLVEAPPMRNQVRLLWPEAYWLPDWASYQRLLPRLRQFGYCEVILQVVHSYSPTSHAVCHATCHACLSTCCSCSVYARVRTRSRERACGCKHVCVLAALSFPAVICRRHSIPVSADVAPQRHRTDASGSAAVAIYQATAPCIHGAAPWRDGVRPWRAELHLAR